MNRRHFLLGFSVAGCGWSDIDWVDKFDGDGGHDTGPGSDSGDGSTAWSSSGLDDSSGGSEDSTGGPHRGRCGVWDSDDVFIDNAALWGSAHILESNWCQ